MPPFFGRFDASAIDRHRFAVAVVACSIVATLTACHRENRNDPFDDIDGDKVTIADESAADGPSIAQPPKPPDTPTMRAEPSGETATSDDSDTKAKPANFVERWRQTEQRIAAVPADFDLRFSLIDDLLNHGCNTRAVEHATWLTRAGGARKSDLHLLCDRRVFAGRSIKDPLALARRSGDDGDYAGAMDALVDSPLAGSPLALALRLRLLASAQRYSEVAQTLRDAPAAREPARLRRYADYWTAIAETALGVKAETALAVKVDSDQDSELNTSAARRADIATRRADIAARAALAAIAIDPTRNSDYLLLQRALDRLPPDEPWRGESDDRRVETVRPAEAIAIINQRSGQVQRVRELSKIIREKPQAQAFYSEIAAGLVELGRPFEAMRWRQVALEQQIKVATGSTQTQYTLALRNLTAQSDRKRMAIAREPDFDRLAKVHYRMGLDPDRFPPPDANEIQSILDAVGFKPNPAESMVASSQTSAGSADPPSAPATPSAETSSGHQPMDRNVAFDEVAERWGVKFRYRNRTPVRERNFKIHEAIGGGVGVIDLDQDGTADLYFAQGSGDPPGVPGDLSDRVYRNSDGSMTDVTASARLTERDYTHGVAVGDINGDGWPDIALGNLGKNRLLINAGDGTFIDHSDRLVDEPDRFTSSIAIADVDGDGNGDIVAMGYIDDPALFDEPPPPLDGVPRGAAPRQYNPARDSVYAADSDGRWRHQDLESDDARPPVHSLASVIGQWDGNADNNEIYIAADAQPDRFWVRPQNGSWVEAAETFGLARNRGGVATASMGIAVADYDQSQTPDFLITNFARESASMFVSGSMAFDDLAPRYNLSAHTTPQVTFGAAAADFNADGVPDVMVLNGHIEDFSQLDEPFKVPAQVLLLDRSAKSSAESSAKSFAESFTGPRFVPADTGGQTNNYFAKETLGRSLAMADLNNDGSVDLVATHVDAPAALLINRRRPDRYLTVRLVGTRCHRDAVGASVTVHAIGDATSNQLAPKQWRYVGGYMNTHDSRMFFGFTGDADQMVEVRVTWPGGEQTRHPCKPNRELLIVQPSSSAHLD